MEESEIPLEQTQEDIHHAAEHAVQHNKQRWITYAALLSALLAVLAAVAGLQSGQYANKAMLQQIDASDAWNYYQAKGIKAMLAEIVPAHDNERQANIKRYKAEQENIKEDAQAKAAQAKILLEHHEIMAHAVTLFQVAIAMTAIAVLARRRRFLILSAALGFIGLGFFIQNWLV